MDWLLPPINITMPTCYYCQKEGHVVYQCPTVPPCAKCGKKGHKATQCSVTKSVPKPAPKPVTKSAPKPVTKYVPKPVPKYVPKPTNLFACFDTCEDTNEDRNEDRNEERNEDRKFSWWREMENDFSFMNIPNQQIRWMPWMVMNRYRLSAKTTYGWCRE